MTLTLVAALAYGLGMAVVGGLVVWRLRGETIAVLREQLHQAREAEAVATDRLVHAWKDGATIPPRAVEPVPLQPLPESLRKEIEQWESPETRARVERKIRAMLDRGMEPVAILMNLDNEHAP